VHGLELDVVAAEAPWRARADKPGCDDLAHRLLRDFAALLRRARPFSQGWHKLSRAPKEFLSVD
jgi:hypothetical protein